MNLRSTSSERCAVCGNPFVPGRYTVRSRSTGRPYCSRCGTGGLSESFDPYRGRFGDQPEVPAPVPPSREVERYESRQTETSRRDEVRRTIAYHEAGHCIAALARGIPVRSIAIDLPTGGQTTLATGRTPASWSAMDDAVVLVSGAVATNRWCPDSEVDGTSSDRTQLVELLDRDPAPDIREARACAERILSARSADVEALAADLIRYGRRTEAQIVALVGGPTRVAAVAVARASVPDDRRTTADFMDAYRSAFWALSIYRGAR